jgi:hypothetical protein
MGRSIHLLIAPGGDVRLNCRSSAGAPVHCRNGSPEGSEDPPTALRYGCRNRTPDRAGGLRGLEWAAPIHPRAPSRDNQRPTAIRAATVRERVRGPTTPPLAMQRAECRTSLRQRRYASSPGLPRSRYPGITDQSNNSTLKGLRPLPSSAPQPLAPHPISAALSAATDQSRDRQGAGSPTNHAAACHAARRVSYIPTPTALRLQPRVAAQPLPWDSRSAEPTGNEMEPQPQ